MITCNICMLYYMYVHKGYYYGFQNIVLFSVNYIKKIFKISNSGIFEFSYKIYIESI